MLLTMEDLKGTTAIPQYVNDLFEISEGSTSFPEDLAEKTEISEIGMLITIIFAAIFTIILLFALAVFIDCRQQKVINQKVTKPRKLFRIKLPRLTLRRTEDSENLPSKMEAGEPSTPYVI